MVEIVFNQNNNIVADVKIVLASEKLVEESWSGFLSEQESELILAASQRENFDFKPGGYIAVETIDHTLICAAVSPEASSIELQKLGGTIYSRIKKYAAAEIFASPIFSNKISVAELAYNIAFGIELGSYSFDKFLTKRQVSDIPKLETVTFIGKDQEIPSEGYAPWSALANGVRYARDLTNEPSNQMTPEIMSTDIKRLEYLGLHVEILDESAMREQQFNLALSVAQGSCNPPKIAVIKWHGKTFEAKDNDSQIEYDLGLVGKGVTFDSGGISLKPSKGMEEMKQDMAGAAAVVGAMKVAALQKLPLNVVAVVGLVENMPSGSATRPGDIVTSMSGQTVEIINTDAEGRLVLADCLWYIQERYGVKKIIDVATLTGAIMVTLGTEMAGIMGNCQEWTDFIIKSGAKVAEKAWPLPLNKEYDKLINSPLADMKNVSSSRYAGSIVAACFLQRYIQKNVQWAHVDIAGMTNEEKGRPLTPKGATGFGVRLFAEIMKKL